MPKVHSSEHYYDKQILILRALHVIGSEVSFDLIEELNGTNNETNRVFFHNFLRWGRKESVNWIYVPWTPEEISHVVNSSTYKNLGFLLRSVDDVHFFGDKCPTGIDKCL